MSVGMNNQPTRAIATIVARKTTAVAAPRRPNLRSSRSTAGLSASARNSAMKTQERMWREIQRTFSVMNAATRIPITTKTVRGRKWTQRSRSGGTACSIAGASDDRFGPVSLRGRTVEHTATLPDGRNVVVHVGVPDDPYIKRAELE